MVYFVDFCFHVTHFFITQWDKKLVTDCSDDDPKLLTLASLMEVAGMGGGSVDVQQHREEIYI